MTREEILYYLKIAFFVALVVGITVCLHLSNTYQTASEAKRLKTIMLYAYILGFILWGLTAFAVSKNSATLMHLLFIVIMLVVLPVSLFSVSVASVTLSNRV